MEWKRGIDKAVAAIAEQIKTQSIPVNDAMLKQVATVSANNDISIGELVADAYSKIGKEGIITIEDARGTETEVKVVEGMQFNQGFLDPFYINNQKMNCELKNPLIFIYDRTLSTWNELVAVLEKGRGKPLLIICNDLEGEAYATLRTNRVKNNIPVCAIQAPAYGEKRKELLQDIAILTGGTVISEQSGYTIDALQPGQFGTAESIIVTKDKTTIVGGGGDKKDIDKRAMELRTFAADKDTKPHDKRDLEERAAKITGGVAVMYVGGMSAVEIHEKKDRCDDAVRATKAALEEGVVSGGGQALLNCKVISQEGSGDEAAGYELINRVLSAPLRQMCVNAGVDAGFVVRECQRLGLGYNVATDNFENLIESGIIDPAKVVRVALRLAVS